jgi:hypothetical protein
LILPGPRRPNGFVTIEPGYSPSKGKKSSAFSNAYLSNVAHHLGFAGRRDGSMTLPPHFYELVTRVAKTFQPFDSLRRFKRLPLRAPAC